MSKKIIFQLLFILNILLLFLVVIQPMSGLHTIEADYILLLRINLTYFILIFWIWNIIIWKKRDQRINKFLLLFFLPGLYTLFYYRIILKNKWIENKF